jgi:hypothetical protein
MNTGKVVGFMLATFVAVAMFLMPEVALAQTTPGTGSGTNTGILGLSGNWKAQAKAMGDVAVYIAFFVATFLVVIAGFKLKQHSDDERAGHLKSFGWYLLSGIILATAGAVLGLAIGTFYGTDAVRTNTGALQQPMPIVRLA